MLKFILDMGVGNKVFKVKTGNTITLVLPVLYLYDCIKIIILKISIKMEKHVFALLFLAFSTMLSAQQTPRTEQLDAQKRRDTYSNRLGYDSVQFTISTAKDTLLTTFFNLNGQLWRKEWVDSSYVYDVFGRLREVVDKRQLTKNGDNRYVATTRYNFDGSLMWRPYSMPTGQWGNEHFDRKNNPTFKSLILIHTPSVNYSIDLNNAGRKQRAFKSELLYIAPDSVRGQYDTTYYDNGQVFEIMRNMYGVKTNILIPMEHKVYTKNGVLLMDALSDSLFLMPFKDNIECYYGLKNKRGDTVFTPRFDNIKDLSAEFWQVEEGAKVSLMRKDGKVFSAVPMDNIAIMLPDKELGKFEDENNIRQSSYQTSGSESSILIKYFSFKKGRKFGIIDAEGRQILPPQYNAFVRHDSLGIFFEMQVKDSLEAHNAENRWEKQDNLTVIDRQGKFLFGNRYPNLELTGMTDVFKFSETPRTDTSHWYYMGLVDKSGAVLLDAAYTSINLNQENRFFWVSKGKEIQQYHYKGFKNLVYGLFDPQKRQWVLPCVYRKDKADFMTNHIVLTDMRTQKQGIVLPSGAIVLPFVYDTIMVGKQSDVWAVAQNGQYQRYDLEKQALSEETYQYLSPIQFFPLNLDHKKTNYYYYELHFFVAQKNDKWGLISLDGTVVVPFIYDYAGSVERGSSLALVKDNQATIFSDWLFPLPDLKNVKREGVRSRPQVLSFKLQGDKTHKVFAVNTENRVLYPPQYHVVQQDATWSLLENAAKEQMILFMETEKSVTFPYKKQILWASPHCLLAILKEKNKWQFDIMNLKTQEKYQTITGGAVAIDAKSGTYFVKTDTPFIKQNLEWANVPSISYDTFLVDDTNWKMFDAMGKPLTTNTFRYPIKFVDGVGIGAVDDKFGVWRADGSTLLPPQYKNARFTSDYRRIILYENRGLKNWLQLIEAATGKTLISTGRYDGISGFHNDYALVSLGDKIGLIDTNGREIIAPMSLHNDTYNLVDSLVQARQRIPSGSTPIYDRTMTYPPLNIGIFHPIAPSPDSLHLPQALRNRVWHYLLETQAETLIERADTRKIQRANSFKTYNDAKLYREFYKNYNATYVLSQLFADSLHISFALTKDSAEKSIFKNYVKTKTGWEAKRLSDILNLSKDNILKINNLMREKLKKLDDKDIDCGESTSFVERTQNTFLAHAKGISFCFVSGKKDLETFRPFHYVPVLLTWAELKAFLN